MSDFIPNDRSVVADRVPTERAAITETVAPRIAVAPRMPMMPIGPLFSSLDMAGGIVAAFMVLFPLAMAALAVGRY